MGGDTKTQKKRIPLLAKLGVGAMAGAIGTTAIYPVDMVKTRMMSSNAAKLYKNPVDCAQKILKQEGARGFYKGLNANLLGVLPEKAIKLTANEVLREALEDQDGSITLPSEMVRSPHTLVLLVVLGQRITSPPCLPTRRWRRPGPDSSRWWRPIRWRS